MRLVVADCSLDYSGRLDTHLPRAVRLIIVKADGAVAIHADSGRQPLNWFGPPNNLTEEEGHWLITNAKGERLAIELHDVLSDSAVELGEEPGLQKDAAESEIQRLIAERVEILGDGLELIRREYPTPVGPVDLLCRDLNGGSVAVEIKRRGGLEAVEQVARYVEFLNQDPRLSPVRGLLAAQLIKPQAKTLAEARGVGWVELDYDELRGIESAKLRLF